MDYSYKLFIRPGSITLNCNILLLFLSIAITLTITLDIECNILLLHFLVCFKWSGFSVTESIMNNIINDNLIEQPIRWQWDLTVQWHIWQNVLCLTKCNSKVIVDYYYFINYYNYNYYYFQNEIHHYYYCEKFNRYYYYYNYPRSGRHPSWLMPFWFHTEIASS